MLGVIKNVLKTMGEGLVFSDSGEMLTDDQKEAILNKRGKSRQEFSEQRRVALIGNSLKSQIDAMKHGDSYGNFVTRFIFNTLCSRMRSLRIGTKTT